MPAHDNVCIRLPQKQLTAAAPHPDFRGGAPRPACIKEPMTTAELPSGIDLSFRDESVRPQDDLFAYVNGR